MKTIATSLALLAAACLNLSAQSTTTEKKTEVTKNADGSVTKKETTTVFNSDARTKVVKYFDPYKTDPYGLPPQWVTKVNVKQIPPAWRGTKMGTGTVVAKKERTYLIDAPPELISVLPTPRDGIRYYVAGSNVIAVDPSYKIVDSIQIPSVKFEMHD